ncbi:MAG: MmgE/PrpD family protein [Thermodesulfobacteriota bacterium]
METVSGRLAGFITETGYDAIPEDVLEICRKAVLDVIGCIFGAIHEESCRILEEFVLESEEGKGNSTIIGTSKTASMLGSILVNASRADALEYSDVNKAGGGHPGCMVVPTALAVAETYGASGKDLLTAVALGYEAHRAAVPLYPQAFRDGIHLVMFGGTFGAMATAGKLMGLSQPQVKNAFGICAVVPVAPFEPCRVGGQVKDLYTGWSARTGVLACLLAKKGLTGTGTILEGDLGLYRALHASKGANSALEGLGEDWITRATCVKPHASCRFTHSSADAALGLALSHDFRVHDIEEIEIVTDTVPYQLNRGSTPITPIDARFSIPYVVAVALSKRRPVMLDDFSAEMLTDPVLNSLSKKVLVRLDKSLDALYPEPPEGMGYRTCIMKIRFTNGRELQNRVDYPKGDPMNPVTFQEVTDKFKRILEPAFSGKKVEMLVEWVRNLEECPDCRPMIRQLGTS